MFKIIILKINKIGKVIFLKIFSVTMMSQLKYL